MRCMRSSGESRNRKGAQAICGGGNPGRPFLVFREFGRVLKTTRRSEDILYMLLTY